MTRQSGSVASDMYIWLTYTEPVDTPPTRVRLGMDHNRAGGDRGSQTMADSIKCVSNLKEKSILQLRRWDAALILKFIEELSWHLGCDIGVVSSCRGRVELRKLGARITRNCPTLKDRTDGTGCGCPCPELPLQVSQLDNWRSKLGWHFIARTGTWVAWVPILRKAR
jgi:hypothetical protein